MLSLADQRDDLSMATNLDLAALLAESEQALWRASAGPDRRRAHAVANVTNDHDTYELWRLRHTRLMRPVANAEGRFAQPAALRAVGVRLIRRTALVDYLREHRVVGSDRAALVTRLRRVDNARRALLDEHRDYLIAASSEACVDDLLRLLADPFGPRLLAEYRGLYAECFAAFCERIMARDGAANALPDRVPLKSEALRLRQILTGVAES